MLSSRPIYNSLTRFSCVVLSYSLLLSLYAPFHVSGAVLAARSGRNTFAATPGRPGGQRGAHRDGELIVRFRPYVSEEEKERIVTARGARRGRSFRGASGVNKLILPAGRDPEALAAELRLNPAVEFAEPNYLVTRNEIVPDDPRFGEQWALKNTGGAGGRVGADVDATRAWEVTTGAASTVIAVIDSGVDFTHPDLAHNQWTNRYERANERDDDRDGYTDDLHGWDWVADGNRIKDEQGHGTSVAGIIAAEGNNALGTAGVMWRASLMSLRVLDATGAGDVANAVEAIDYAVAHGARVINLSWGLEAESVALRDAIGRASSRGVVVVCSAGNDGRNLDSQPYYPASYDLPNIIPVAATDASDNLTSWSNWGTVRVAVAAPGVNLLTTRMGGDYHSVTGTSAAAPLVAGIAGLVRTAYPRLNAGETRASIVSGARQVAGLSGKVAAGGVAQAATTLLKAGALETGAGSGNGNGNENGSNGDGNGNVGGGNGQWQRESPRPDRPERGVGGHGPDGSFNVAPPEVSKEAPGRNLPNLDELRKLKSHVPQPPAASATISANLLCADCDTGTGGGYVPPGDALYARARTEPRNETGQAGVDLGSQNFNWSAPLLQLPGRAGLDLSLSLHYNSLVWTRQDYGIKFNADRGFPGPGFRLGFPSIQERFHNAQVGVYSYMMVTPSGGRVELRQVGGSNVYEAQDSSYTQMIDYGNGTALVRTTDGTQLSFITISGEMRCHQIKDRNGNFITVNYDGLGHPTSVIDTLGRTVNFNYDGNGNLISITQLWNGATHMWASFTYEGVYLQGNFPGLSVNGPNNSHITVLKQVWVHDGSRHEFNYTSWGQVNRITKYAADNHQRSYTSYNLPADSSAGQADCPRFTERRDWAESWNNGAEVVTHYAVAVDGSWSQVTQPDGAIHKEFFAMAGWQRGLTTLSEVWSGGARKKWTTIDWTQDDTNAPYQINPRPADINIRDAEGNRKRTTISYTSYALPFEVTEYAADGVGVLRRTQTHYRFDAAYVHRRIIGLKSHQLVYDANWNLVSKTGYVYDAGGGSSQWLVDVGPVTQHDSVNYGKGFDVGRGNLCFVQRYDVTDPDNAANTVATFTIGYNVMGAVTLERDPLDHDTRSYFYADKFSDGNNGRNTYAYPTEVKDADYVSTQLQYNYDLGVLMRTQGPPPLGQAQGLVQTMQYDGAGRIEQVTTVNNGAYTRWVYPSYQNFVLSYASVQEGAGEAFSGVWFDGAGRLLHNLSGLPNSAGGYALDWRIYDAMGRVKQQAKPTEINANWVPSGDDAAGWVFTYQQYDWQGRPTLTTLADGATRELTYGGCGCAGGELTTVRDERGRRKSYLKDVLGRLARVEELNWDTSVYATTHYSYNGRDQLTGINQAGLWRGIGYDGHGRVSWRSTPEQGATHYGYHGDDTLAWVSDARGATASYTYNKRHLVTNITYGAPSGVTPTSNVRFEYDAAGNRTARYNDVELRQYAYDQMSRLKHEDINFPGMDPNWRRISYGYNLAGQLARVTNPWGAEVAYAHDSEGQLTGVTGANYANVGTYASNLRYRAFGGMKGMTYGNGRQLSMTYDTRMRLKTWEAHGSLGWEYYYDNFGENSGRVTYARNLYDASLDRSYDYDHVGRLRYAHTGVEARMHAFNQPSDGGLYGPYAHHYHYDVFGNTTGRNGWGGENPAYTATFNNNRRDGFGYDPAGNLLNADGQTFTYDVEGQQTYASGTALTQHYDGERLRVKKVEQGAPTYYLRSTMLGGQVVAEMIPWQGGWAWSRGYVYLGGQLLAMQQGGVQWVEQDPVVKSQRLTNTSGYWHAWLEFDPWGGQAAEKSGGETWLQTRKYTTYERDANGTDEAMHRRYNRRWSKFDQPDPYDGSYNLTDPQSFNRYSYVQNDPVNFVDPSGLNQSAIPIYGMVCDGNKELLTWRCENVVVGVIYIDSIGSGGGPIIEWGGGDPQKPVPAPPPTPTPQPNPCAGVKASDLNYDRVFPRGGKPENGRDHITRRHILLDGSKTDVLTPSRLPIIAQSASKYVFQDGTSLSAAQASVGKLNAAIFEASKHNPGWSHGNIIMTGLAVPQPAPGGLYIGTGYDKKRGFFPTLAATLILDKNCKDVITSYAGLP